MQQVTGQLDLVEGFQFFLLQHLNLYPEKSPIKNKHKEYSDILSNISDIEKCHRKMVLGQLLPNSFANLDKSYFSIFKLGSTR